MCLVKHKNSGKIYKIVKRSDDDFMEVIEFDTESPKSGDVHKICSTQYELIECDNLCNTPCFFKDG